jgi:DNA (cytosine-5)-methyltransferase 1
MRFDLSNDLSNGAAAWRVRFFFGPSKDVREIDLDGTTTDYLTESDLFGDVIKRSAPAFRQAEQELLRTTPSTLQLAWAHKVDGMGPFAVTDQLGALAAVVHEAIDDVIEPEDRLALADFVVAVADGADDGKPVVSEPKLRRNASWVLAGIIVGEWFNTLAWHHDMRKAA